VGHNGAVTSEHPPTTPGPTPGHPAPVPPGGPSGRDDRQDEDPRLRRGGALAAAFAHPRLAVVTLVLLCAMLLGGLFIPVPYVIEQPGPAIDVLGDYEHRKVLEIDGHKTYPTDGELMMTTVAVSGGPGYRVTPAEVMRSWFDRTRAVSPRETVFPDDQTQDETSLQNTVDMKTSQQDAIAVALDELDVDYTEGVFVAGIEKDAPAQDTLEAGDQVLAVGGRSAQDTKGFQELTAATPKGQDVDMTIRRDGTKKDVQVPTEVRDGSPKMGIVLAAGYDFPFDVKIGVGEVGGPSAGTMFALSVYDQLTPGSLTDGQKIAGTGTIDDKGKVGPIGGIRQKLVGASDAGADFFLAPGANCEDVAGAEPDGMSVVRVDTFDDALGAVRSIAKHGDAEGLPTCEENS
jgi:PDZ domain-containing protein